jgi:hypothetical protein
MESKGYEGGRFSLNFSLKKRSEDRIFSARIISRILPVLWLSLSRSPFAITGAMAESALFPTEIAMIFVSHIALITASVSTA